MAFNVEFFFFSPFTFLFLFHFSLSIFLVPLLSIHLSSSSLPVIPFCSYSFIFLLNPFLPIHFCSCSLVPLYFCFSSHFLLSSSISFSIFLLFFPLCISSHHFLYFLLLDRYIDDWCPFIPSSHRGWLALALRSHTSLVCATAGCQSILVRIPQVNRAVIVIGDIGVEIRKIF